MTDSEGSCRDREGFGEGFGDGFRSPSGLPCDAPPYSPKLVRSMEKNLPFFYNIQVVQHLFRL